MVEDIGRHPTNIPVAYITANPASSPSAIGADAK
jgi:hypothetical protein